MSTLRNIRSYINIGKYRIDSFFEYTIFEKINCLKKVAKIEIIKKSIDSEYTINNNDICTIDIEDRGKLKIRKFDGNIKSINIGINKISIIAIENFIPNEIFEETFQNSGVSQILKYLDKKNIINFLAEEIQLDQFICFDSIEENIIRVLETYKILNKSPYIYSVCNKQNKYQIVVRNTKSLPETFVDKHNIQEIRSSFNQIVIVSIPELSIGDIVKYKNHEKIVNSILTNSEEQIISIEDK